MEDRAVPAAFAAGDLVTYRVGTGAAALGSTATAVFVDEYTPAGALVQSIALPTAVSGSNHVLTASGSATSEGLLTLSADGRYLLLAGYDATPGTTAVAGTTSAAVNRVVGRIDATGSVDTTTALNNFSSTNNPRSATSTNGTDIWVTGGATGIAYTTLGATTAAAISSTVTNIRQTNIFAGQLYISTGSGSAVRVGAVGTGTPTVAGQTIANLPGIPTTGSPYGFFFADLDAGVPGVDTLYVADDTANVIQKYSLVSGTWTTNGTVAATTARGLTGVVSGTMVKLYVSNGPTISTLTDSAGYNATITGTLTAVATAGTNTAFRGVALVPQNAALPDLTASAAGPAAATAGTAYNYTLTVGNGGAAAATGVAATFTLPAGVTYNSAAVAGGFTASQAGGVVTFSGGSVGVGGSVMLTVSVTPTASGTVTLSPGAAVVDPANAIAESNETNNSSTQTVTTNVGAGNTPPTITSDGGGPTAAISKFENTTAVTTVTATDAETPGTLTYSLDNTSPDFSKFTLDPTTHALSFVAAPNFEAPTDANTDNVYVVTVKVSDGTATTSQVISVTVQDVNEVPSFTLNTPAAVNEDVGAQTVPGVATAIKNGPDNEAGQTVSFILTPTGTTGGLTFSATPTINGTTGALTFTPAANANGTATYSVVAKDTGGTANGGVDTSAAQTLTITVNAVNDAPSFTVGGNQTVLEDAGGQSVTSFATGISAGPANEAGQAVTFQVSNNNTGLFGVQPAVDANGKLTYTPAANANGTATVTVTAKDNGGTTNGGMDTSAGQTFVITVTPVNDAPSFSLVASTVSVNLNAGPQTVPNFATGISAGPPDEAGQTLTFQVVTNTNAALFSAGPSISPSGTLTYTPATGASGTAMLTIALMDSGGTANGGVDKSAMQPLTINVVAPTPTTTTVASSAGSIVAYGTPVTYTATVTATTGTTAPTAGSVTFYDNGTALGTATTFVSSGTMTTVAYTTTSTQLRVNNGVAHTITATYTPGTGFDTSSGTTSQTVTPATLTVTGVSALDRVYDSTTVAPLNAASAALSGKFGTDAVTLGGTPVGTFADKNVAMNKPVTVSGFTISGADSGNYNLSQPTGLTASVSQAALTVTGVTALDRAYDATTVAPLNATSAALSGKFAGDVVTLGGTPAGMFADKNVGANKPVTVSGFAISGADSGNYNLSQPTGLTASVSQAALTVAGVTALDRAYNATKSATLDTTTAALSGKFTGDAVTLDASAAAGMFADKNVGTNKPVTITGVTIGGSDSGNYTLTQPTATASISKAGLTVGGVTALDRAYNATTTATLNTTSAALVGKFSGDAVTLDASTAAGTFADKNAGTNIAVTTAGFAITGADVANYTLAQPTTAASISKATLSVTGVTAMNKVYDATTAATIGTAGSTLMGVFGGENVTLDASAAAGMFATKAVGTNKPVTVSGLTIGGSGAGNYTLTQPTATASITPKALAVTGVTAADKVYDATTAAAVNAGGAVLAGVISGDAVTLTASGVMGAFATKTVGTNKPVLVSGLSVSGADAGNYTLAQPTAAASITKATLTAAGVTANDKVYDGTTTATVSTTGATLSGAFAGDSVMLAGGGTGTFTAKTVGTNKPVAVTGLAVTGADAGNYALTPPAATASITPKAVTVTGISAKDKVYDGTTAATLNTAAAVLSGGIAGDAVTVTTAAATGTFATKTAGTNKPVTVAGVGLTGADAGNYTLTQPTAAASITPKTLGVTGVSAAGKVYDGTTTATVSAGGAGLTGVVAGDAVALSRSAAAGAFATKTVGTNKPVAVTGLAITGADAGNYSLTQPTAAASITPKAATVTGVTAADKVYDGTTAAAIDVSQATLGGVISGDAVGVTAAGAAGAFATKTVGTNIPVAVAGIGLVGADAGNYTLTQPAAAASITPRAATVVGVAAADKVYDGTTAATLDTSNADLSGVVLGDSVAFDASSASGEFATKTVGPNVAVAVSGVALTGSDAGNYTLTQPAAAASITPKAVTAGGVTAADKMYDGTTTAAVNASGASLTGTVPGNAVAVNASAAAGTFATKNVGTNVAVAITGLTLGGADAGNYTLAQPTATAASITPRAVTVTAVRNTKPFDGTTRAAAVPVVTAGSLVGGDVPAFTETYDTPAVGADKTLTPAGSVADGNGGNNYAITFVPVSTGEIVDRAAAPAETAVSTGDGVLVLKPDGTVEQRPTTVKTTFGGGLRPVLADVTGDGTPDVIVGSGPGRSTLVQVFDGVTGAEVINFAPFEPSFTGGVFVTVGDLDNDGTPDIVVTPDEGGGPRVTVYSGTDRRVMANFFGIDDPAFRGGARAAVGDINGDGQADLLVAAGFGGGPRVSGYDGASVLAGTPRHLFDDFFVFEQSLRNGVYVAVGDLDGDGFGDLIFGGGPDGGPRVYALSGRSVLQNGGASAAVLANFFAGDPDNRGGVRLAVKNLDGDRKADLVVGSGPGVGGRVTGYAGASLTPDGTPPELFSTEVSAEYLGGVFVG